MSAPAITTHKLQTDRLLTHLYTCGPADGTPVVLVHGNVSSARFFTDLLAALPAGAYGIAPDLRGYGESETKPVDATRGVRDWSDDLHSLIRALGLTKPVHLLGWSLGGGVVMQYAIDHPEQVASLTLMAPVSPYGFGATKGLDGALTTPDAAGSGGGGANPDFIKLLAAGEMGSDSPLTPRNVMNGFYFKPPFRVAPAEEDALVAAMNRTALGEDNYPGDLRPSTHWPMIAPGDRGVLNTLAPTHFNVSKLVDIQPKPPILWVRGADDQIVADNSVYDLAFLGQIGAVPGWPGLDACPPQPMVSQMRAVLARYQANGGRYQEVVYADCGHAPHIEKAEEFAATFLAFVGV